MTAERAELVAVADDIITAAFDGADSGRALAAAVSVLGAALHRRCGLDFDVELSEDAHLSELVARAAVCYESTVVSLLLASAEDFELPEVLGGLVGWALESLDELDDAEQVLRQVCTSLASASWAS